MGVEVRLVSDCWGYSVCAILISGNFSIYFKTRVYHIFHDSA
jgi:hypothetical protein